MRTEALLVTGGAGYIGSHFLKFVQRTQPETKLVVIDRKIHSTLRNLPSMREVVWVEGTIGDQKLLGETIAKHQISTVVHFAANLSVAESQQMPHCYLKNNVAESLSMFEVMEELAVRRIVFSSSCACYATTAAAPIPETTPTKPVSVYGLTKLMVEESLKVLAERLGWRYVCLRYFNASGADEEGELGEEHEPEIHLIPLALKVANQRLPELAIYGTDYPTPDGTCIRDYVHVTDLADAHLKAINMLDSLPAVHAINLGSGFGSSVLEIVQAVEHLTGRKVPTSLHPRRPGDGAIAVADISAAKRLLAWTPHRSLDDILASAWMWERESVAVS